MIDDETKKKKIILGIIAFLIISLFIFLAVYIANNNYINNVNFKLNGASTVEIEVGTNWTDPSVIATYKGKSIISKVEINNNVNISIPGQYKIIYTIKKGL